MGELGLEVGIGGAGTGAGAAGLGGQDGGGQRQDENCGAHFERVWWNEGGGSERLWR